MERLNQMKGLRRRIVAPAANRWHFAHDASDVRLLVASGVTISSAQRPRAARVKRLLR
jgi:hypothetical protein